MAYATPAQFVQGFGLRETAQLLQDEQHLLSESLLDFALQQSLSGASWKDYLYPTPSRLQANGQVPSVAHFASPFVAPGSIAAAPLESLRAWGWQVFSGNQSWGGYTPVAPAPVPTVEQFDEIDSWVISSIKASQKAADRLLEALEQSSFEMDGYLRGSVPLPIVPEAYRSTLLDECCWTLARCRLADDCDNSSQRIEKGCEEKRAWLKQVAKGTISLVLPTGQPMATTSRFRTGRSVSGFAWGAHRRHTGGSLPEQHSPLASDQDFGDPLSRNDRIGAGY